jgi:hypothetical protein
MSSLHYQTFTLPFFLWSQVLLVMNRQTGRGGYRNLAIAVACLGGFYDWDVYFWIVTAAIFEILWPPSGSSRWRAALPWAVPGASTFALFVTQIVLIAGSSNELLNVLLRWIDGSREVSAGPVAAGRALGWFSTVFTWEWQLSLFRLSHGEFTGPLLLAAFASVIVLVGGLIRGHRQLTESQRLIALWPSPGSCTCSPFRPRSVTSTG